MIFLEAQCFVVAASNGRVSIAIERVGGGSDNERGTRERAVLLSPLPPCLLSPARNLVAHHRSISSAPLQKFVIFSHRCLFERDITTDGGVIEWLISTLFRAL